MLGLALGGLGFALGWVGSARTFNTNLLVLPIRNAHVGGLDQRDALTKLVCVVVEYRVYEQNTPKSGFTLRAKKSEIRK